MKKNITYLCMAAAALLASSCTQNEEITPTIENEGRVPVLFTAKNSAVLETRADGVMGGGENIGISMLPTEGSTEPVINAHFKSVGSQTETSLVPTTDAYTIYYPADGSNVKFNAYLPYDGTFSETVTWNFVDKKGEFFYTATTEGDNNTYNKFTGAEQSVSLAFKHELAQIRIFVNSTDYTIDGSFSATISNHPSSFTYNIATNQFTQFGEKIDLPQYTVSGNSLFFNVLPEALGDDNIITFHVADGVSFQATLTPPSDGFKAGIQYEYETTLTATKTEGTFKATLETLTPQKMGTLTSEEVQVEP